MILIPQDSYQIRVANMKEDGHEVMITAATRSTDFQDATIDVACGAMAHVKRGRSRGVEGDGPAQEARDRFCGSSSVVGVILEISFYGDPPLCSRMAKVA